MTKEAKRPVLPSTAATAAADITADILTPPSTGNSIRSTMMIKAQSLASLLASDRKQTELSHPWFSSDLDDVALDQFALEQPDPAMVLGAAVAVMTAIEVVLFFVIFG